MAQTRNADGRGRVCVLAPSPLLTITIECSGDDADEVHLHPGGQGFWIARLIRELGAEVVLCTTFGGESGSVIRGLLEDEQIDVRCVSATGANGAYIDDRRRGERDRVAEMPQATLSRHEVDELYGMTLVESLEADLTVLAGPGEDLGVLPADLYRRLAADLVGNGRTVLVDLSGEPLSAAVEGGASVVKVSHEALLDDGSSGEDTVAALVAGMERLGDGGARAIVCSRAEAPALASFAGRLVEIEGPVLEPIDHRGAGDSFTAGLAAVLASGGDMEWALRLGAAAGILNVTRRGLGTGVRSEIEKLAEQVEVRDLDLERA